jgi:hypothetical protein
MGTATLRIRLLGPADLRHGEEVLAPPESARALQSMLDGGAPHGRHYCWKFHRLPGLPDEVIDLLVGRIQAITSPFSQIGVWAMGGMVSRVDPEATAVGGREVGFDVNLVAAWPPPDPDGERHVAWVREAWEALRPHTPASTSTSSPTRAPRGSRPPTASGSSASPP